MIYSSSSLIRVSLSKYPGFLLKYTRCTEITSCKISSVRLVEVGKCDVPKLSGQYDTGQLFLHRVFGYRGVILFPWIAKVYDRDVPQKTLGSNVWPYYSSNVESGPTTTTTTSSTNLATSSSDESASSNTQKALDSTTDLAKASDAITASSDDGASTDTTEASNDDSGSSPPSPESYLGQITKDNIRGSAHTYYQVLIDDRDCQYLKHTKKAQTEAVTFLGNHDNGRTLYAVPGLDYVGHEDVIPYTAAGDFRPIHHDLFHKFLQRAVGVQDPPFEARSTLRAWQERNHPWLELSDVHRETTDGVRVTVIPFYMGCREAHNPQASDVYWWRYCIRLENLGDRAVRLRERHWRIFSLSGTLETVRGRGVVGCEPLLSRQDPAFQYSSHVSLQSPSGHMWGTFRMEREDGYMFECRIPPFSLESKQGGSSRPPATPPTAPTVD